MGDDEEWEPYIEDLTTNVKVECDLEREMSIASIDPWTINALTKYNDGNRFKSIKNALLFHILLCTFL